MSVGQWSAIDPSCLKLLKYRTFEIHRIRVGVQAIITPISIRGGFRSLDGLKDWTSQRPLFSLPNRCNKQCPDHLQFFLFFDQYSQYGTYKHHALLVGFV